jgi:hypothetical protein
VGRPTAEEWELPSEAFEQRQEILEGGRPCSGGEDQLLVDDGPVDQVFTHFSRKIMPFEKRLEILEGGRPCSGSEDQCLVDDGPVDQGV